jgi:outer membrane protein assembly factor BamB
LERQSIPEVPSPLYHDGRVYIVKNGGILTCVDASTGKRLYRKRIGSSGTHYASPVLCNDLLYIASGAGHVAVVDISGETPEILAKNNFDEQIFATPAIIDNTILVRTARRLYAIAAP